MNGSQRTVSVIVPTLGLRERTNLLDGALASVERQTGIEAVLIVVLNGTRACPDVERRLAGDRAVRLIRLDEADLPTALAAGRRAVRTPYFTALDDDDELLPHALDLRVTALEAEPELDLVVTDGIRLFEGEKRPNIGVDGDVDADPLRALLRRNWLLPGSWLCRSERVGPEIFAGMPRYLECTFLAARFSIGYRLRWIGEPSVLYRVGSPLAETSSRDYVVGQAEALRGILALELPPDVRRGFERRVTAAYHVASEHARRAGRLREAWRWHLKALVERGGWKYLSYSRHLIRSAWN